MLGEEGTGDRPAPSGFTWAVDPVDGTWNFASGIPHWCVVIACADAEGPLVGVIHDAPRGETWSAVRGGEGLMLNGAPAPPRPERAPDETTWAAALGRAFAEPRWMRLRGRIGPVRITGSLGLDLAWTAAGRIGALAYTCSLNPWDVWAGELMARERGLEVIEEPENRLLMVMPRRLAAASWASTGPEPRGSGARRGRLALGRGRLAQRFERDHVAAGAPAALGDLLAQDPGRGRLAVDLADDARDDLGRGRDEFRAATVRQRALRRRDVDAENAGAGCPPSGRRRPAARAGRPR